MWFQSRLEHRSKILYDTLVKKMRQKFERERVA